MLLTTHMQNLISNCVQPLSAATWQLVDDAIGPVQMLLPVNSFVF